MKILILAIAVVFSAFIIRPGKTADQISSEYMGRINVIREEAERDERRRIHEIELRVEMERLNAEKPVEIRKAEIAAQARKDTANEISSAVVGLLFVVMVLGLAWRYTFNHKRQ